MTYYAREFWQNELNRWSYMTDKQLITRLKRIKKQGKLECYIAMARRQGKEHLEKLGVEHYLKLFGENLGLEVVRRAEIQKTREFPGLPNLIKDYQVKQMNKQKVAVRRVETVKKVVEERIVVRVEEMERALEF